MMKRAFLTLIFVLLVSDAFAQEYSPAILTGQVERTMVDDFSGLQPEVVEAFKKMAEAAAAEGIKLKVISGFRSYDRQVKIWNTKYKEYRKEGYIPPEAVKKIVEYSTIPGTSRHHWGTDLDIIDEEPDVTEGVLDPDKFGEGGPFHKMKVWMDENASDYGFLRVYTDDTGRKGFHYEPWHYSYASLSIPMLKAYMELDLVKTLNTSRLLGGQILDQAFMERYTREQILDINPKLID